MRRAHWAVIAGLLVGLGSGGPALASLAGPMRIASVEPAAAEAVGEAPGPRLRARISLSDQLMYVYVDDVLVNVFAISSGRRGYGTPPGEYKALWLSRNHRSRKYDWAPMPWSVFFNGGYAVHGTTDLRRLGRPASHGCIRLHPDNAKIFFKLVVASGRDNTSIIVVK